MNDFALDVLTGLSAERKSIPTKYFYDERGSALFSRIMELEEYYPTRCETEILSENGRSVAAAMRAGGAFSLVELGSGDGRKTQLLLEALQAAGLEFRYVPIDISEAAVAEVTGAVRRRFHVPCRGLVSEYFEALQWLDRRERGPKLVLFLGGNIGNFAPEAARVFLRTLWSSLRDGDHLLIGFDLKKDVDVMLRAYNDSEGVTRRFNLNVLERINRELGGGFDVERFDHYGPYNVVTGAMESYLVSQSEQEVEVGALRKIFKFRAFEPIFLEYSFKFLPEETLSLAHETGFRCVDTYFDRRGYYLDALWRVEKPA